MAFEYLAYVLSQDEEISNPSSLDRSLLREVEDQFHLNSTEFRSLYRLSPDLVEEIVSQLDSQQKGRRIKALSTGKQVNAVFFSWNESNFLYDEKTSVHTKTTFCYENMYLMSVRTRYLSKWKAYFVISEHSLSNIKR